jgi:RNA polymerase-binding transcription factor DksA
MSSNDVPSNAADIRASLEAERTQLLVQIDELTVGGEIDLDFDDDFADRGQVAGEQGENQVLARTLQTQLTMVERAITRIDDGTYGTCSVCGTAIGDERQAALPATDRCIEHA